jgi:hypothetical protein
MSLSLRLTAHQLKAKKIDTQSWRKQQSQFLRALARTQLVFDCGMTDGHGIHTFGLHDPAIALEPLLHNFSSPQ